jgi:peptidoglycan/LPS O-acetylase OafA/YrhL
MRIVRVLVPGLSALLGAWVLLSFAGLMINPANAAIWTTSLMWSLLAGLFVMPILVVVHHMRTGADQNAIWSEEASKQPAAVSSPFVSTPEEESPSALSPSETDAKGRE